MTRAAASGLSVEDLVVQFGGKVAVNKMSLRVGPGQIIGLIGPNGAGKTTVLNAISRLVPVTGGRIHFDASDLLGLAATKIVNVGIGRTFQAPQLVLDLPLIENVVAGGYALKSYNAVQGVMPTSRYRREEAHLRELAQERLELCGVAEWTNAVAMVAPYGVLKLTEIARALMTRPRLLLLDEPAAGVTRAERDQIGLVMQRVVERDERSILVIDHDIDFISKYCSTLYVMNFGELLAVGDASSVTTNEAVRRAYLGMGDD